MVATRGKGPMSAAVGVDKTETTARPSRRRRRGGGPIGRLTLKVRDRVGTTELLEIDRQGRFFVPWPRT